MRKSIDKLLGLYDKRIERREELFERTLSRNVEAMADRAALKRYATVLVVVNSLLWLAVLVRPHDVLSAFKMVGEANDKIVAVFVAGIFGVGLWLTYAIFRLKFNNIEDRVQGSEFMSSFADSEKSTKRIRIWVLSVVGGVLNLLALGITFGLLVS